MFLHEWYKIWHNRKLVSFLFVLLILNAAFFWYRTKQQSPAADAYKKLTKEIRDTDDVQAMELLSERQQDIYDMLYEMRQSGQTEYPKYCRTLFDEKELYAAKLAEYTDAAEYSKFVKKAAGAAAEYRVILRMLGGSEKKLQDMEKTSSAYASLQELEVHNTHSKAVSEALSLPSLIFLEILMAVLYVSVVFSAEKEQGLLRLYSSMKNGRGRMFLSRIGAITLACAVTNLFFLLSTIGTGCLLYGKPVGSFLAEPIQSLSGYRQAILPCNIGTFLLMVYLWSVLVSLTVVTLTAFISSVVSSAVKVYVILFAWIGIEGILYLKIDDLSYLAFWKRYNLISFANPGYTIARHRNGFLFGRPVVYPVMALLILVLSVLLFGVLGWLLCEKGIGVVPGRKGRIRLFSKDKAERSFGCHTRLSLHEGAKYFFFERIGLLLVILLLILSVTTKPYRKSYSSLEEMFYQSYIYRLAQAEPEQYADMVSDFYEELAAEQMTTSVSLANKEAALQKIDTYVSYLSAKDGARVLDSRGYEMLFGDRKQNVILGVCAILAAILCGTALMAAEYRSGMAGQIRISPRRRRVYALKALILFGTLVLFFLMIYGRYLYQVLAGYGTEGIGYRAYSIAEWTTMPGWVSVAGGLALVYGKRFLGMALCAFLTVLLTGRLKSFLLTAVVGIVVFAVPLLLCLKESGALSYIMLNLFFV